MSVTKTVGHLQSEIALLVAEQDVALQEIRGLRDLVAGLREQLRQAEKDRDKYAGIIDMLNADMPCDVQDMYPEAFE